MKSLVVRHLIGNVKKYPLGVFFVEAIDVDISLFVVADEPDDE